MTTLADVSVRPRGSVVVLSVDGEIDRSNAEQVSTALVNAVPNVAKAAVLDLSATAYIDSSGVQLLFQLASRLKRRQQELCIVVPEGANIGRLLSVVALERTVPVHTTLDEALAEIDTVDPS